ncbi:MULTISPECIES: hypothetical protein [Cyanophyceae]|uniref:Uncharacterized protein n=1 Tax=Leptolyngbya subtilissima DQ-A4 TaxID=2933933 RepID=A0ABV0KCQ8_9CYAN|nr:hypothetical protein [Nodosilinea sp. FACHB-141]MBD2115181.1 hypothetical protein [Nodosilinea sp. FACHB-141]
MRHFFRLKRPSQGELRKLQSRMFRFVKKLGKSFNSLVIQTSRYLKEVITVYIRVFQGIEHEMLRSTGDLLSAINRPTAVLLGMLLGYAYGPHFGPVMEAWTANLLLHPVPLHWWEGILQWLCALVWGVSGWVAAEHYERLLKLRRAHSDLYGEFYEVARPTGGWLTDILWGYLAGFVIMTGSFVAGCLFWPFLPFLVSRNWFVVGLLLLLLASGWQLVALGTRTVLTDVFKPRRLEYEVQNPGVIIPRLKKALDERRKNSSKKNKPEDDEVRKDAW